MSRKDEIITGLVDARRKILDAASALPPEKQDEIFLGVWSIKDLLAHLAGWDYTNIQAVKDIQAGRLPAVFKRWNPDWTAYNAELVAKYKRDNFAEMLAAVQEAHQALIEILQRVPEEDIDRDFEVRSSRGANITIAWFLQGEIDDEGRHHQQIQDWLVESASPG